jgi:hypothetical protein
MAGTSVRWSSSWFGVNFCKLRRGPVVLIDAHGATKFLSRHVSLFEIRKRWEHGQEIATALTFGKVLPAIRQDVVGDYFFRRPYALRLLEASS